MPALFVSRVIALSAFFAVDFSQIQKKYARVTAALFAFMQIPTYNFSRHPVLYFQGNRPTDPMPISIAQATPADLESLLVMMRQMQLDDPWEEPFREPTVRANLAELLQNPAYGVIYLVREAAASIAYLVICFDYSLEYRGKGAWIDELFVEPAYRGKGIGTQLLDLAERASREHHARVLHLEVNHGNAAIELYRRCGFTEHPRFLMSKPLDQ